MPAKKQVTKEMILGAALRVLMEGGTEAVNVKSLAAELGCSTQPIYLSFDNMDALRKELIPTAVNKFVELMQKECGSTRVHERKANFGTSVESCSKKLPDCRSLATATFSGNL